MTSAIRMSRGLYRTLLFTYPRDFRLRFGSEMIATFSDQICDEWKQNGLPGALRVWRSVLGELFYVAVPLQLRSSILVAMSLSFLWSFALFMALFRATSPACSK
jgi:hypothetical protein